MTNSGQEGSETPPPVPGDAKLVYETSHDMTEYGLVATISTAIEEAADVDSAEIIRNFSEYADPDAVNRVFRTSGEQGRHGGGRLQFEVEEFDVVIYPDGDIEIYQQEGE